MNSTKKPVLISGNLQSSEISMEIGLTETQHSKGVTHKSGGKLLILCVSWNSVWKSQNSPMTSSDYKQVTDSDPAHLLQAPHENMSAEVVGVATTFVRSSRTQMWTGWISQPSSPLVPAVILITQGDHRVPHVPFQPFRNREGEASQIAWKKRTHLLHCNFSS